MNRTAASSGGRSSLSETVRDTPIHRSVGDEESVVIPAGSRHRHEPHRLTDRYTLATNVEPGGTVTAKGVHHVDLAVSDVERSLAFYLNLLGPLGWKVTRRYPTYRGTEEVVYLGTGEAYDVVGNAGPDAGGYRTATCRWRRSPVLRRRRRAHRLRGGHAG